MKHLLFKPIKNNIRIRKLSNNYLQFDYIILIDKDNNIIGYTDTIYIIVYQVKDLPTKYIKIIGKKRWTLYNPDDELIIYQVKDYKPLKKFKLDRMVRGLRYADNVEVEQINECIVLDLCKDCNITFKDKLYNNSNYGRLYSKCMELDLIGALFSLEDKGLIFDS